MNYEGKLWRIRSFRLHFNRINMQRGSKNVWTVHVSNKCIPSEKVECFVPVTTVFNPKGKQPRAFLKGLGEVWINKNTVYIIDDTVVNYMNDDDFFLAIKGKRLS